LRVKITLAYDGSRYLGFQVQNSTKQTVAQELYDALHSLHIYDTLTSSGRTDKNVHATNQVIHIDLPPFWVDTQKLHDLLNHKLPQSIRIKSVKEVDESFHARFSPKQRTYRYLLSTNEINAFSSSYISYVENFDIKCGKEALDCFLGEHDFRYFQKSGGGNGTTVRTIFSVQVYAYEDLFVVTIRANGFLRSQIRMIISAILAVNNKKLSIEQLKEQIDAKKQYVHGLAPASGLYLTHIKY
jgi:tRNA pseudouridine38-40 synthase